MLNMITNFDNLCSELEKQELEAPNGVASPTTYAQLLAIYLYQNDLCNAKFLWKRIPPNIISSNPEIAAIWTVGQKLWKKDLAGTYQALAIYNWTEPISNIIRALEERVRERALNLIGRSYSSISHNTLVSMTGLSNEAIAQICKERKWELSEDGTTIKPIPPVQPTPLHTSSEDQLFKLTEFVTFLEN
ncbi:PREDICTED: COP9 signalosome complex subunit 8 [Papilio xuthus]|uniref:COP9 signalosome complex subunit 8 n=2 Tax=Papilio xuthus TaxID=66420 RepID=A0AAJ6ZA73_PAPXU|nr:PREDICTED: COP9 signalosome complex subunit 8 [Papilio xuthus]XP_013168148.1 PREDICTED: COP9 signalosome complex subunit 8 [Papilio xuthus]